MIPVIADRLCRAQIALLLYLCAANAFSAEQDAVVETQDEPRHHVVFENAYVRIIETDIAPGDTTLYHRHRRNNAFVLMGDSQRSAQVLGSPMSAVIAGKQGDLVLMRVEGDGLVHRVFNAGRTPLRFTDIELIKPTGDSGRAEALTIKPTSDNELYRAYRLTLGPGAASPSLTLNRGVHVIVAGAQLQRIDKDGRVTVIEAAPHAWQWHEAGTFVMRNPTSSPADIVEIELR